MVRRIIKKVSEMKQEDLHQAASKHLTKLQRLDTFFYEPPLLKVPIVLIITFLLGLLLTALSANTNAPLVFVFLRIIIFFFISTYLIFFVIHLIRRSLKRLLTARNMWTLFFGYALFIFSIMLLFSSIYDISERTDSGYLKYGQCTDTFTPESMHNDSTESHNYFYFSATTLLTVGYGDVCPMGLNRYIAIINAFIGNFINVVLMVWVISNYMRRKNQDDENGNGNDSGDGKTNIVDRNDVNGSINGKQN